MIYTPVQKVIIIVAVSENDAIGKDNELLFHLKEDLKNFKKLTTDNVVVMGRKTFESIGKQLPNRINVVVSRKYGNRTKVNDNLCYVNSFDEAINMAKKFYVCKDIYIIGGGQIYKEALEKGVVDEIILTRVKKRIDDADTFFPKLDYYKDWTIENVESYNESFNLNYDIVKIVKKR